MDRSGSNGRRVGVGTGVLVALLGMGSCGKESAAPARPASAHGADATRDADAPHPAESAGAPPFRSSPSADAQGACVECHARIATDWSRTGMARALGPVEQGELDGLSNRLEARTGYRYGFELLEGSPTIVETREGDPDHRLEAQLTMAIGSGERDRAFTARWGASHWFAPLEVLTSDDGTRHTAFAPGHTIQPGSRFTNPVTPECLGCHTDALPRGDFPLNLAPPPDAWQPRGISCAACHGSVERHARLRQEDVGAAPADRLSADDDPVLRIGDLSRVQRLSLCAACHLQGDARIVLAPGQLGPPRPGGDLLDQRALFVAAHPTDDVGFVSQVERLALSPCFLESNSMDCTTCHDPHRTLHDDAERQRVRANCARCHVDADHAANAPLLEDAGSCSLPREERPAGRDCVSCHMRRTGVFDVEEVEVHDHFIQRAPGPRSPRKPLRTQEDPGGNWKRFAWPGVPPPEHADDPGIWMMALFGSKHFERAAAYLDRPVHPRVERLPMLHHVRGSLLEAAGRPGDARAAYERALALDPDHAPSAINLGLLLGKLGEAPAGVQLLTDLLTRFPKADGALRNRAVLHHGLGDLESVVRDLEAAQALQANAAVAANLAALAEHRGDREAARRWRQEAHALDPVGQPPVR